MYISTAHEGITNASSIFQLHLQQLLINLAGASIDLQGHQAGMGLFLLVLVDFHHLMILALRRRFSFFMIPWPRFGSTGPDLMHCFSFLIYKAQQW